MSTLALLIFVVMALFTAWFIPWYHPRDPEAVIRIRAEYCRERGISRYPRAYNPG